MTNSGVVVNVGESWVDWKNLWTTNAGKKNRIVSGVH